MTKKNQFLELPEIKKKIFKYLYTNIDIKKVNQTCISNETDLGYIKNNDYIICPKLKGTRIWIIFTIIDEICYAVNFKKYNKKISDIYIHPINILIHKSLYLGTIMEGVIIKNGSNIMIVVDEIYILSGVDQLLKSKCERLKHISNIFQENIKNISNFFIHVTLFYKINEKSLEELYIKIKSDPDICGINFYPNIYGKKNYYYLISPDDLIDDIVTVGNFFIQKTKNPDVYPLFIPGNDNKIGIAYIPNEKTSKMCRQWFKNTKETKILIKCHMHNTNSKKWIPIEIIDN